MPSEIGVKGAAGRPADAEINPYSEQVDRILVGAIDLRQPVVERAEVALDPHVG